MLTNLLIKFQEWIIACFNKEGIFIHGTMCLCFFLIASILAYWAIKSEQFKKDDHDVRLGVFDEDELGQVVIS